MPKRIITISREFGSGGRQIGQQIAAELGITCYDKALIALVAAESGFDMEFVEATGEYAPRGKWLGNIAFGSGLRRGVHLIENLSISDRVHLVQNKVISEIAARESCVIVGRAADYILRERDDCLHVFIHAPMAQRVMRARDEYHLDAANIEKEVERKNKLRANHYKHYTGQTWGLAANYHLCLDSGAFGLRGCQEIIVNLAKK